MVNVRGQLLLCCSLHGLLGLRQMDPKVLKCNKTSDQQNPGSQSIQLTDDDAILAPERLLVTSLTTGRTTRRWTFPVNEAAGVHRISNEELRKVPSTVGSQAKNSQAALFSWNSRTVSLVDTNRFLRESLSRSHPKVGLFQRGVHVNDDLSGFLCSNFSAGS